MIFEADTPAGKAFDVILLLAIGLSVLAVMLESVASIRADHGVLLLRLEWGLTLIFTVEYALRLMAAHRPLGYATSFFGVVDLLSILPTYLSLILPGAHALQVIRVLRLLRVFRVLKLAQYSSEGETLRRAMWSSRHKIIVFLGTVLSVVMVFGTMLYVIEGEAAGFDNIPRAVYWAVVTLTTVGYGDIAPRTPLGQAVATAIMILGYAIIAVPTGIVTVELNRAGKTLTPPPDPAAAPVAPRTCARCGLVGHDGDARYCKRCGTSLSERAGTEPEDRGLG